MGIPFLSMIFSMHRRNNWDLSVGARLSGVYTSSMIVAKSFDTSSTDMRILANIMAIRLSKGESSSGQYPWHIPSRATPANEIEVFAGQHDFIWFT